MARIELIDLIQHVKDTVKASNLFENFNESQRTAFSYVINCYFKLFFEEKLWLIV